MRQTTEAIAACLEAGLEAEIIGIAISNQRESVTIWDADDGQPLGPVVKPAPRLRKAPQRRSARSTPTA